MDRLVMGCGSVGVSLAEKLAGREASLLLLTGEESRVESLRDDGIDARCVDVTDADAIRTVAGAVGSVVVDPADPGRTAAVASAARRAYPDAFVLACVDDGTAGADRERIAEHADRLLETTAETADYLLERAGGAGRRTRCLQRLLRGIDGTLAVVAHNDPDPDAIASAVGLARIAARTGVDAEPCYFGAISHHENRALVNLLAYDLERLDPGADLESYGGIALVDHSRPGINDGLPEGTPIDVVIDHHPPRASVEARFVDLRRDVGATSTILVDHLERLGIDIPPELATGLLYGIRTDTRDFTRGVSTADFEASAKLIERADAGTLQRVESPSIDADTLETVGRAISNRTVEEGVLTSCVGPVGNRDALAQAADKLLEMEDVSTTLVFGYTDETVYVSARSRGSDLDLGEALREAFDQIGSAGGHADMAGAQIPVGILLEGTDDENRGAVVEEFVTERFFETLGIEPDYAAALVYAEFLGTDAGE